MCPVLSLASVQRKENSFCWYKASPRASRPPRKADLPPPANGEQNEVIESAQHPRHGGISYFNFKSCIFIYPRLPHPLSRVSFHMTFNFLINLPNSSSTSRFVRSVSMDAAGDSKARPLRSAERLSRLFHHILTLPLMLSPHALLSRPLHFRL